MNEEVKLKKKDLLNSNIENNSWGNVASRANIMPNLKYKLNCILSSDTIF